MNRKRILCVDDEPQILKGLRRLLEYNGYEVLTVPGAEETLDLLDGEKDVDLIILDLKMPGMDGLRLFRKIRKDELSSAPVVILTGLDSSRDIIEGYKEGAAYFITKPYENSRVMNIVDYLIGDVSDEERKLLRANL